MTFYLLLTGGAGLLILGWLMTAAFKANEEQFPPRKNNFDNVP
ncbi:MAG: hypothetical protein AB8E74_07300 [Prochlorococcus sp.]|mgnify:CR=1 FL=1